MARIAAIDIGSNSILLTIADRENPIKILVDEAHVTGLSKGLSKEGLIQPDRLSRSLKVLTKYRKLIDEFSPDEIKVAATEALRKAKNGDEVKKQIEKVLKVPVDLISGEREAELSFLSVQTELPNRKAEKIVFDIGGASTEVCLGSAAGIRERISVKVGSVVITEKFDLKNKCDPTAAIDYVLGLLKPLDWKVGGAPGIGVAGTITSLLAMELKLETYSRAKVHGQEISADRVNYWLKEIASRNLIERKNIAGLSFDRADVFSGGLSILVALMTHFHWKKILCMDSGVRFGLIYDVVRGS